MNSHVSSSGMSPFKCCLGYQPPLFLSQEDEVGVPSAVVLFVDASAVVKGLEPTFLKFLPE